MKSSAYFICISRGGIADDDALLDALRTGQIAGAGLDAHGVEPLPPESPFWSLPNVIVTPHNGATSTGTRRRSQEIAAGNLRRFVTGEPLHNIVDKSAGY
jgi:phosphoglycerate dehydrogenase-like enzyme